jgi:hypothetical protein
MEFNLFWYSDPYLLLLYATPQMVMNRLQLILHHVFRFIWNAFFVISYPILASFGLLFIGITYFFSWISKILMKLKPHREIVIHHDSEWAPLSKTNKLLEARVHKQIMFGPTCFQIRRSDGIPSVLQDNFFGNKIKFIEEGIILERWNATDTKDLPDFDICLYDPDQDSLKSLTNIKCYDWHLSERVDNNLLFKWFDGIQGGEVKVAL